MSDPEGYRFLPHAQEQCQCEGCQRWRNTGRRVTAPNARQNDELREALRTALEKHSRTDSYYWADETADALLPVVTVWAEKQARARAAEVIARVKAVPAYTLTSDDGRRLIGTRYALVDDVLDALAAADRTDAR